MFRELLTKARQSKIVNQNNLPTAYTAFFLLTHAVQLRRKLLTCLQCFLINISSKSLEKKIRYKLNQELKDVAQLSDVSDCLPQPVVYVAYSQVLSFVFEPLISLPLSCGNHFIAV